MRAVTSLFLLLYLSACASVLAPCPKRPEFLGSTWADLAIYTKQLQGIYDSCAG